ncbi:unnamed protein product [Meganyctiphanes norvegica]|uniref:Uncharacterized protein n=1 Tax=Meganyctiphanes norvegica TaxID=48144 RepID=A0AAV2PUH8_MEGNR
MTVTTTTVTSAYTCASAVGTAACSGRRLRRELYDDTLGYEEDDQDGEKQPRILSSMSGGEDELHEGPMLPNEPRMPSRQEGRVMMTVWSTASSTFIWTSTSINSSTTFSVSFYCTVAGAAFPPSCG